MAESSGIKGILGLIFAHEAVSNILKRIGEAGTAEITKALDATFRKDFGLAFQLQSRRSPALAARLAERLRRAEETGEPVSENDLVKAAAQLLPRDGDNNLDEDAAVELLDKLAEMPESTFAALMNAMKHDVVAQKARLVVKQYGVKVLASCVATFNFTDAAAARSAARLEPVEARLRARAAKKGIVAWWHFLRGS